MKYLHFQINLTLNTDSYYYQAPKAQVQLNFDLPADMFDRSKLAALIEAQIKGLEPTLEAEIQRMKLEAEAKAKADAAQGEDKV